MLAWLCSLGYFRFYVVLAFIILIIASVVGIVYPIWEARDLIAKFLTGNTFQELIEKSFHGSSRGGSRYYPGPSMSVLCGCYGIPCHTNMRLGVK